MYRDVSAVQTRSKEGLGKRSGRKKQVVGSCTKPEGSEVQNLPFTVGLTHSAMQERAVADPWPPLGLQPRQGHFWFKNKLRVLSVLRGATEALYSKDSHAEYIHSFLLRDHLKQV